MTFAAWQPALSCVGSARPGAKAIMRWALDSYDDAYNLGIYNCRNVRGAESLSPHAEGRACDIGMPMTDGKGSKAGHALVKRFIAAGNRLGIVAIIYDRRIWSARSPSGRAYTGVHPHYNHVHVEITRQAAEALSLATVRHVMRVTADPSITYEAYRRGAKPGSRTLRKGNAGDDVAFVQRFIGTAKCGPADGYFGARTFAGVRWYQGMRNITVDGIVGPQTWRQLLSSG